jgi:hypothetical protein
MFWKMIRWGGTVAITLLVFSAALFTAQPEADEPPLDTAIQFKRNFNF